MNKLNEETLSHIIGTICFVSKNSLQRPVLPFWRELKQEISLLSLRHVILIVYNSQW